jgi:hypothetical protein
MSYPYDCVVSGLSFSDVYAGSTSFVNTAVSSSVSYLAQLVQGIGSKTTLSLPVPIRVGIEF